MKNHEENPTDFNRRQFLQLLSALGVTGGIVGNAGAGVLTSLAVIPDIENPLKYYPDRGWEKVYLDQYKYDDTFTWVCAPNDTHMCRMRAFVRNGVFIRSEQNYDHDRIGDLYGNKTTKPEGFYLPAQSLRSLSS
jgi:nitrate reductase alpha subunit